MNVNTAAGEQVLDALLLLGYWGETADDGASTATYGMQTVRGKAEHGAIEWSGRSAIFQVTEQAYIAKVRKHIGVFQQ